MNKPKCKSAKFPCPAGERCPEHIAMYEAIKNKDYSSAFSALEQIRQKNGLHSSDGKELSNNTVAEVRKTFLDALTKMFEEKHEETKNAIQNILSMREIGNKSHGDLGEVAIAELMNSSLENYSGKHVGKELFRSKNHSEDVVAFSVDGEEITISLKAYGVGPLQLSTDREHMMFPLLESVGEGHETITDKDTIEKLFETDAFTNSNKDVVISIIYDERSWKYKVISFEFENLKTKTKCIRKRNPDADQAKSKGKKRLHPVWVFEDKDGKYLAEVRYGGKDSNALQRGLWSNTLKTESIFVGLTKSWVEYSTNKTIVQLIPKLLNISEETHRKILNEIINATK